MLIFVSYCPAELPHHHEASLINHNPSALLNILIVLISDNYTVLHPTASVGYIYLLIETNP